MRKDPNGFEVIGASSIGFIVFFIFTLVCTALIYSGLGKKEFEVIFFFPIVISSLLAAFLGLSWIETQKHKEYYQSELNKEQQKSYKLSTKVDEVTHELKQTKLELEGKQVGTIKLVKR
jgi:hypothetical protein